MGHSILMGRKTLESIGKALPGRTNVVITRQKDFQAKDCLVANSIEQALKLCKGGGEFFIIGGATIFKQALKHADRIYLTLIHHHFEGDTHLFKLDKTVWQEIVRQDFQPDVENPYPFSFLTLERKTRGTLPARKTAGRHFWTHWLNHCLNQGVSLFGASPSYTNFIRVRNCFALEVGLPFPERKIPIMPHSSAFVPLILRRFWLAAIPNGIKKVSSSFMCDTLGAPFLVGAVIKNIIGVPF